MKKYFVIALLALFPLASFASQISVPSATGYGVVLIGKTNGNYQPVATSTLNISTTNIVEGTKLFYTTTRFDNRLSATTTLPNLTTLTGVTTLGSLTGLLKATAGALSAASNGTDFTLITAKTCTGSDFFNSVTAAGVFGCATPSGGGSGNVSTSTGETSGQLAYWTSTNATPALLGKVATTTLSGGGPITVSNSPVVIGASGAVLGCATCVLTSRNINTTFPLQGGGALSGDLTLSSAFGTTSNTGLTVDQYVYTNHSGILVTAASSSETCTSPLSCASHAVLSGGGAITIQAGGTSQNGYISSTDWNTFNNKIGWGQATSTSANQFVYTDNNGKLVSAASSSLSLPNSALQNSSVTVNSQSCTLGSSCTVTSASSTLLTDQNKFSTTLPQSISYASTTMVTATTASTTNLIVSGAGNGSTQCAQLSANGTLSGTGSACGSGGGGITTLGPTGQGQTGSTQTLATSTSTYQGLTSAITIVGSGNIQTFTPSLSGILTVAGGGTGATDASNAFANLAPINTKGDLITTTGAGNPSALTVGSDETFLQASSTASKGLAYSKVSLARSVLDTLGVANGGTGSTTLGGILAGGGTKVYSIATSSASCSSGVSCSSFTVEGSVSPSIIFSAPSGSALSIPYASTTMLTATTASTTNLIVSGIRSAILQTDANGIVSGLTTSAGLASILSDETGSGAAVFGTSPTFSTSIVLPNGTGPTFNAAGNLALDTTSNNLLLASSTNNTPVVIGGATTTLYAFTVASTSPDFASGGVINLPAHFLKQVVTGIICQVMSGTSQVINLSSEAGTADTNTVTCTTTSTQYAITSNYTFNAYAVPRLELGTKTGSPNYLIIRVVGYRISD